MTATQVNKQRLADKEIAELRGQLARWSAFTNDPNPVFEPYQEGT